MIQRGFVHDAPRLAFALLPDLDGLGGDLGELGLVEAPLGQRIIDECLMLVPLGLMTLDDGSFRIGGAIQRFGLFFSGRTLRLRLRLSLPSCG